MLFNKIGDDLISTINVLLHDLPTLTFIIMLLFYINFFVEKYYEIKMKKEDVVFKSFSYLFSVSLIVAYLVLFFVYIDIEKYRNFQLVSAGFVAVISLSLAIFFVFYGVQLAQVNSKRNKEKKLLNHRDREFTHKKIMTISIGTGLALCIRGLAAFFECLAVVQNVMNKNIFDFILFAVTELGLALIIGIYRYKRDGMNFSKRINKEAIDFNKIMDKKYDFLKEDKMSDELNETLLG